MGEKNKKEKMKKENEKKEKKIIEEELVEKAKENVLKPSVSLEGWPEVKGYDFDSEWNFEEFIESLNTTGFQAHNLYRAIQIVKKMQDEKATIFLGYTSNMISSGIREIIKWLVKHKKVHFLATTAGGIEEDIIKCFKPFVLGSYDAPGKSLREEGVNRTGNLFIPNDRYLYFERFMNKFWKKLYNIQKETGKIFSESEIVHFLGKELDDKNSVLYWAYKNNIPYFAPALYDGSIGDTLYFFKKQHPDFLIDNSNDIVKAIDFSIRQEGKTGIIAIGGSIPKHLIANINLFREGADYAVYINTALEIEGSNAGANIEEAISWGKVKSEAKRIKVYSEATLVFPLLVKAAFVDYKKKQD